MYVPHENLGFRLAPNFRGRHRSANYESDVTISTNSRGLGDEETGDKRGFRMLGLGDSMTFPFGVTNSESYLGVMERAIPCLETVNTAVPAYGTLEEWLLLRLEGLHYEPDVVLVGFYLGNEIYENLSTEPTLTARDGYLVSRSSSAAPRRALPGPIGFLRTHYHTCGFVMDRLKSNPSARSLIGGLAEDLLQVDVADNIRLCAVQPDARVLKGVERTEAILRQMKALLETSGTELIVALIPFLAQVDRDRWNLAVEQLDLDRGDYDPGVPARYLKRICQRLGIDCVDLTAQLIDAVARGEEPFFPYNKHHNKHLSVSGHYTVAKAILSHFDIRGSFPETCHWSNSL